MPKTYVTIATQTLTSAGTITFSNIPQNYTDLELVVDNALSTAGTPGICLRFNGDSGSNYSSTYLEGFGQGAPSFNSFRVNNNTYINSGYNIGLSATSNQQGAAKFHIQNYSNGFTNKTVLLRYNQPISSYPGTGVSVGTWRNTSPITSINVNAQGGNFASGAIFTLYGIEAAKSPKAIGGDKIYTTGTHWIHEFYNSGLFIPDTSITAEFLVVAGGGGGGSTHGGGGGGGGFRTASSQSLTLQLPYTITVGGGGNAAITGGDQNGTQGSNSSISGSGITTITSAGGGYGAGGNKAGGSGGSGGGAAGNGYAIGSGNTPSTSPSQGNNGGSGRGGAGGGGGGAGAVGSNSPQDGRGAAGGNGASSSITGSSVTYAGGGGGGGYDSVTASGGSGGGGAGASNASNVNNGVPGTANTGGGGGGGGYTVSPTQRSQGGKGGSGIVIVRYPV